MNKSIWIRNTKWYMSTFTGKFIWDFEVTHLGDDPWKRRSWGV